ncbi:SIR2 family protein [Sorangium sp. So ce834]|uniref:SIR2 family protein n=1 Tax=Sorangium sp. So ce834 TaxID=3133321 RepID=UPI003F5ED23B
MVPLIDDSPILIGILRELREACVQRERSLGDLHRNAALWLARHAGLDPGASSFELSHGVQLEVERLHEAAYLGAVGFARAVLPELGDMSLLADALRAVLDRRPHTKERCGYADDPWTLLGLLALADGLKEHGPRGLLENHVREHLRGQHVTPGVVLAAVLVLSPERLDKIPWFCASDASPEAVLAAHAKPGIFERIFPGQHPEEVVAQLLSRVRRGEMDVSARFESILMLTALEVTLSVRRYCSAGQSWPRNRNSIHAMQFVRDLLPPRMHPLLQDLLALHDNRAEFERLTDVVRAGKVLPFVGAGVSIPSGFPGWTRFLEEAADQAGIGAEVRDDLANWRYEAAAGRLESELGRFHFQRLIENTFGRACTPQGTVLILPSLTAGSIITTNFDRVLETTFQQSGTMLTPVWGTRFGALQHALFDTERYLIKLHGDANDDSDRVLTEREYDAHYGDDPGALRPLPSALRRLFSSATILFIGCSLNTDRTLRVLRHLVDQPALPAHYAIVEAPANGSDLRARRRTLGEHRIVPIWYPSGQHEAVEALVRALAAARTP